MEHKNDTHPIEKQSGHTPGEGAPDTGTVQETTGTAPGIRTGQETARHSRRMKRGEVRPGSAWALVTGAGSGIGRCYALRLAALGYRLVIVGNNAAPLEAVAEEIRRTAGASAAGTGRGEIPAAGIQTAGTPVAGRIEAPATPTHLPEVRVMPMDLARVGAAQELHDRTAAEGIEIDVVINNAGIFSFCDILTTPAERIERIILLHDLTVSQLCRLYAADMVRRGVRGHILNMSSYSLWMPFPGLALYSASKAYMRSFSVAFAKEVRDRGIRVTAVCPAGVATDLYGLTPRWQRIGKRLGVLITPDNCGGDCGLCGGAAAASCPTGGTGRGFPSARLCRCGCCGRSAGSRCNSRNNTARGLPRSKAKRLTERLAE